MKKPDGISRRRFLLGGAALGGAALGGLMLPGRGRAQLPPTYGSLLRMGDNLTYLAQRALLPGQSLVREYSHGDVSSFPAIGAVTPGVPGARGYSEPYRNLQKGGFADWRLTVEGEVDRPGTYSLADLKRLPSQSQITRHTCEEGWTAIAEWTGVPLSRVLLAAGMRRSACCVCFHTYDSDLVDSIDMLDALHPQTLLAYGMNGRDLLIRHGAPLRLRVESQIGYKSRKFLNRIVVKDTFDDRGEKGFSAIGWAWYTGI
jgi:DMSO/TMAO reductase YedYZ molybdopterin-dependent catalytic subunit